MATSIVTNEDCMDLMARYPDKYFDLAVVASKYLFVFIYKFNYKYF